MKYLLLILILATACAAQEPMTRSTIIWDGQEKMPAGWPMGNPLNMTYSLNCSIKPALDHTGKPHQHGHAIQIIVDGGNNIQDPPNPDGSPGGDDSMAYGNINMIRMLGLDGRGDLNARTGTFFSYRFFIPYIANRGHYLRLWEGDSVGTAPYYQNSIEYTTDEDRGGAMIYMKSGLPQDVDWAFGPSQPRSQPAKTDKSKKPEKKK
jgi:hypothetical protein